MVDGVLLPSNAKIKLTLARQKCIEEGPELPSSLIILLGKSDQIF